MRVLVVDDHEVVCLGLRVLLARHTWVERCVHATEPQAAIAMARRYRPHVAVVDIDLAGESGLELCDALTSESPTTRVLLMCSDEAVAAPSVQAVRASGFVSKSWAADEIVATIRVAGVGLRLNGHHHGPRAATSLTPREQDVLVRMAAGATNAEIAGQLDLSVHTVKQHASAAYRKLNARNRTDAVRRAQRLDLVT
jgi:two-component system response regulator DesR